MRSDRDSDAIVTRVAHAGRSDHRFLGHSVLRDIAGRESYTGLAALSATGRLITSGDCRVLDDIAAVLTVADPRIYPLKITRLVSSFGGFLPACAASIGYLGNAFIGPRSASLAAEMLVRLKAEIDGHDVDSSHPPEKIRSFANSEQRLAGFGIPFRDFDERLSVLNELIVRRERHLLPFWKLHQVVVDVVRRTRQLEPNVSIGVAAACLDLGFSPEELVPLFTMLNLNTFVANALEGSREPRGNLRRLPVERIEYVGCGVRKSPRAIRRKNKNARIRR